MQGIKRSFTCRLAPQSIEDPLYIVPKATSEHDWSALDSRGVFLIQTPGSVYVWVGSQAHAALIHAAGVAAQRMVKYDALVPLATEAVDEGCEPGLLIDALRIDGTPHRTPRTARGAGAAGAALGAHTATTTPRAPPTLRSEYTHDFDTLDAAARAAQQAGPVPWAYIDDASAQDASLDGRMRSKGGRAHWVFQGGARAPHMRSGALTARQARPQGSIPPVVPPLQLNTFPISPPQSARAALPS